MNFSMQHRQLHKQEVQAFLQKHFSGRSWKLSLPNGTGNETYFAWGSRQAYFIKLGVQAARYQALASINLTPPVLLAGYLEDGTSIIVQPYIDGRTPSRKDYQDHLDQFASTIDRLHHCLELIQVLERVSADDYRQVGLQALTQLRQKWERYRSLAPEVASFIDQALIHLEIKIDKFQGAGLVASHNDICNANWLILPDGQLFLVDLELMALDDPAVDVGATLWWYYRPELRPRFLEITGHANDPAFENRMRVRMAMHCLNIFLPRENSFDEFDPASFAESLTDFRAALAGEENPQGYG